MASLQSTHILYYFDFSICSLFVRYSFALRGQPRDPEDEIIIEEQHVELRPPVAEQLEESFICDINPRGKVPVLVSRHDGSITSDSRAITSKLAESYPQMIPERHAAEIHRLLAVLHEVEFFALTFRGKYEYPGAMIAAMLRKMDETGVSERHRHALDQKITSIETREIPALKRESLERAIKKTEHFFDEINQKLLTSVTQWVLGTTLPTALDAHLVVFVARLKDVGQSVLVPENIMRFANHQMQGAEWNDLTRGRQTVPPEGF